MFEAHKWKILSGNLGKVVPIFVWTMMEFETINSDVFKT